MYTSEKIDDINPILLLIYRGIEKEEEESNSSMITNIELSKASEYGVSLKGYIMFIIL